MNRVGHGERDAIVSLEPGFQIRHPPPPHDLPSFVTPDEQLFQTIHMGAAIVDKSRWKLVVDGLVEHPFTLSYNDLISFQSATICSLHECYGSPIAPPTKALWRIGNVRWTGVRLRDILERARPQPEAQFVWSDGLDSGEFAKVAADRYQKDLPLEKALSSECLIAYAMNGEPLSKERGYPVRLVVPGWFGTNSTKWLCKLELREKRSTSPFTTIWYNEVDPTRNDGSMRPVWNVEVNSMITWPPPGHEVCLAAGEQTIMVAIEGWTWSWDGVLHVQIIVDDATRSTAADLESRIDFSWQKFRASVQLERGSHRIVARATSVSDIQQPISGRRNHVHTVEVHVRDD